MSQTLLFNALTIIHMPNEGQGSREGETKADAPFAEFKLSVRTDRLWEGGGDEGKTADAGIHLAGRQLGAWVLHRHMASMGSLSRWLQQVPHQQPNALPLNSKAYAAAGTAGSQ